MAHDRTGGPAFPHHDSGDTGTRPGMSLRDYFAAAVVTGLIPTIKTVESPGRIAMAAYEVADAMLAERAK